MRKPNWLWIGILFGVSLFIGYVIFAADVGAFLPSINVISKPLLCSGEYSIETTSSSYRPGETFTSHRIYCDKKDITLPSIMLTGLFFSLDTFILLAILNRNSLFQPENFGVLATDLKQTKKSGGKEKSPLERMSELKEMRDRNLISDVEYERKKDEIMKEL